MTIVERLVDSLGLTEERARMHLQSSFVRANGEIITNPDQDVDPDAKLTLQPPPITEHE